MVRNRPEEQGGFQKLAFRAGLAMLFIRLTALPELLAALLHVNTYLLYIVGPPSILGAIVTGGLGRTFRNRAAWMWLGFLVCLLLSVPTSTWVGGSVGSAKSYALFSFPLLFVVGGLTVTWKEVRATFITFAVSGVFLILVAGRMAKPDAEGRTTMTDTSGTIGNSNDLASLLILVIPFILFVAMDKRIVAVIRWSLFLPVAYALKTILGTASRGALVAIFVMFTFTIFRASGKQKMLVLVAAGVLAAAAPLVVNGNSLERLATLFGGPVEANSVGEEARESKEERRYVLEQSIIASLKHPVFGVGIGQFSNYVGELGKTQGKIGAALHWTETHNAFTEVSSECGLPALVFFVLGIGTAFASVSRTYTVARRNGYEDVADTCLCYLVSMIGYVVSIVFLANAYRLYLPAMIGLAIAVSAAANREIAGRRMTEPARTNGWQGPFAPPAHLV
jgi:hypothetical protein